MINEESSTSFQTNVYQEQMGRRIKQTENITLHQVSRWIHWGHESPDPNIDMYGRCEKGERERKFG